MEQKGKIKKSPTKVANIKQPTDENGTVKIIIAALILALLIGLLVYFQMFKSNKSDDKDKKAKEDDIVEKTEVENKDDDEEEAKVEVISKIRRVAKKAKEAVEEKEEEEKEVYYAITFKTNGGEAVDKQILTSEETTYSVEPVREGWIFDNWYVDEDLTTVFEFGNTLSEDIVLYAKWVKKVNFIYQEQVLDTKLVGENDVIQLLTKDALPEEDTDGFEIAWIYSIENEEGNVESKEIKEGTVLSQIKTDKDEIDLVLEKLDKFEISFYMNEESEEPIHTQTVVEKRTISFDDANQKAKEINEELEEFGWYYRDEANEKWNFALNKVADKSITKLYLDDVYTVIFEEIEEDQEPVIIQEEKVAKDSRLTEDSIPVLEDREDSSFGGWVLYGDESGVILDENWSINGDKTFIPKWIEKPEAESDPENEVVTTEEPINNENQNDNQNETTTGNENTTQNENNNADEPTENVDNNNVDNPDNNDNDQQVVVADNQSGE